MTHKALERWQLLVAKASGRPRWMLDRNREKAIFTPGPAEEQEINIRDRLNPVHIAWAQEMALQTDALVLMAGQLVSAVDILDDLRTTILQHQPGKAEKPCSE